MNAADRLVAALEREGVRTVYGLPGEETEDVLFSLRDADITFVPVRHEQGAAFMADVHGRLTGEAGVCLSTLGPGATNLLTGVADAHLDKSPLVAITGQVGLDRLHKESHQSLDIVNMFDPVTKWNARVSDPDSVNESVRKAFKIAELEKPGATHLELPEDVAATESNAEPLGPREPVRPPRPNVEALAAAESLLADADRPLLLVGNGVARAGASGSLRRLVTTMDVPVVSTYMGKGALSDDDPRSLMTLDSGEQGEAASALRDADLVVATGYDIAEHDPAAWRCEAPVVHVDSTPAEVDRAYEPVVEVVGDVDHTLDALADWATDADSSVDADWYQHYRDRIVADVDIEPDSEAPFALEGAVSALRAALDDEDVLISDVGAHKMTIARNYPTSEPNTCLISNGLASMGIAVPGAVAADRTVAENVVAATGDGGFMMNAAEIETATRIDCSFSVVVFRDDDFRLISQQQLENRSETFGTRFSNPDFAAFAESFGIEAYRPASASGLRDALEAAVGGGMALVEVPIRSVEETGGTA